MPKPSIHVLFILEYYHPHVGGVETLFRSLVDSLLSQGHKVTILTNRFDDSPRREDRDGLRIRRFRYFNRYGFTFLSWIHGLYYAREADIIHTTSYNAAVPARFVAKLYSMPSVITFHEYWGDLWKTLPWISPVGRVLFRWFENWISNFPFDRIVAVSDSTKTALEKAGVPTTRLRRIYNGISYDHFSSRAPQTKTDAFQFLFFGRPSYSKGVDLLIEALATFDYSDRPLEFHFVFPSESTPILRVVLEQIGRLPHQDQIFISYDLPIVQLQEKISSVDAVIIPSYSEGFCFAAVETMALGTPIISSGQGALSEVVSGPHITMNSFDAKGLSEAMESALNGQWSISKLKKFPINETVMAYEALYREILDY
ncbi:MAG: glycosyltransferase family 4 protein [Bacteroidota bacterium]